MANQMHQSTITNNMALDFQIVSSRIIHYIFNFFIFIIVSAVTTRVGTAIHNNLPFVGNVINDIVVVRIIRLKPLEALVNHNIFVDIVTIIDIIVVVS